MFVRTSLVLAGFFAMIPVTGAQADEIFVCNDRTLVHVTTATRAVKYQEACVKDWFLASEPTAKQSPASTVAGSAGSAGVSVPRSGRAPEVSAPAAAPVNAPAAEPGSVPAPTSAPRPTTDAQSALEPKVTRGGRRG
jgi:hypothetical protein